MILLPSCSGFDLTFHPEVLPYVTFYGRSTAFLLKGEKCFVGGNIFPEREKVASMKPGRKEKTSHIWSSTGNKFIVNSQTQIASSRGKFPIEPQCG